jgi:pimeloyl-ACP methyl ester carboxylesterase
MGMINPTARRDGGLSLPDGRSLAYAEWGTSSGPPVLLFHGGPGSRLFCPDYEATMSSGVRLITIDRPGFGGSDPHPGRTLLSWADDVAGLADALHLDRFAVIWNAPCFGMCRGPRRTSQLRRHRRGRRSNVR